MGDNFWRTWLKNSALSMLIEYGVFLAVSMLLNDENEYYYAFLMMLAFWGVQIVVWIKNHIVYALFYHFSGRRQWIDEIENNLRQKKMPIYEDTRDQHTDEYLERVFEDQRTSKDQALFVGAIAGALNLSSLSRPTHAWRLRKNFEVALRRYAKNSANIEELQRAAHSAHDGEDDARDKNGYETSALDELSDEESERQSNVLMTLKAKTWLASGIIRGYHTREMPEELAEHEWRQYLKIKDTAYRHLDKLTDEFFRNTAMHFIIDMLVVAQDVDEARNLLALMTIDFIKEKAQAAIAAGPIAVYENQRKVQKESKNQE